MKASCCVFAGSDTDPGAYYMLDRQAHSLHKFLGTRARSKGVTLAHVKPITYPAADGQMIPGVPHLAAGRRQSARSAGHRDAARRPERTRRMGF